MVRFEQSLLDLPFGQQSFNFISSSMEQSNLLKFVEKGPTTSNKVGIRTFPHQTYGVSLESPEHFRNPHTIIAQNTYHYQHQHAPEFEYHSQKKNIKLHQYPLIESKHSQQPLNTANPYRFHLKKGRLSQFIDKNGWMNTVYTMTGQQRTPLAREASNKDRSYRLSLLKEKSEYSSHIIPKPIPSHNYYKTIQDIMSEKVRIRTRRLKEAESQLPQTHRVLSQAKSRTIDKESVTTKMASTNQQWYKGKKSDRRRQFSLREGQISKLAIQWQQADPESKFSKTYNLWQHHTHLQHEQQLQ